MEIKSNNYLIPDKYEQQADEYVELFRKDITILTDDEKEEIFFSNRQAIKHVNGLIDLCNKIIMNTDNNTDSFVFKNTVDLITIKTILEERIKNA